MYERLCRAGLKSQFHKLDNEAPKKLTTQLTGEKIDYQLVSPYIQRLNPVERAIRIFKNHFIVGLCSTDPNILMQCWYRLLKQAKMTLNMSRPSRLNNKLSAYTQIHSALNFNATPLAPPGKVLVHEAAKERTYWDPHGVDGWYVGLAMKHYRCFRCYISTTNSERIAETVDSFQNMSN